MGRPGGAELAVRWATQDACAGQSQLSPSRLGPSWRVSCVHLSEETDADRDVPVEGVPGRASVVGHCWCFGQRPAELDDAGRA